MPSKAATVDAYLAELPDDRRAMVEAIRKVIRRNMPKGYEEGMQYGMIGYYVPHSIYPAGYHCDPKQPVPFAGIGSQKNYVGIYLMCIYGDTSHREWFINAWKAAGKKLDMGAGCVRIKTLDGAPLEVIGEAIRRVPVKDFLAHYEASIPPSKRKSSAKASPGRTKSPVTGAATKESSTGKPSTKKPTAKASTKKAKTGKRA